MVTNKQKEKIYNLISQKQEGAYWDFKREWYSKEKQADLLHDIICMANNMECRDAYIIIGIDEEKECSIQDVKNDSNRRNTQKMVDFLRDKKFAGGVRPRVVVEPLQVEDGEIDIIIIKNDYYTPYFLEENYKGVNRISPQGV
ncbi:RNA-binding domain-containing protein [Dorea longicatena]|uniref:ATP-binding protein n=1 Tax=Dorea longicatena TaxID=88431 RepID=A0A6N9JX62_9FIRM|nr:ATP-binding protein [Dorea longicatena]MZK10329.1 ATP-binding protein [Dorea longicatena]MZK47399.1 ATP-binding protein [Dorea longicatena]NSC51210.1 ATP-binding protein [Dorea longicatena]NSD27313.1 ATP-binding protein [Dorea longicatena]